MHSVFITPNISDVDSVLWLGILLTSPKSLHKDDGILPFIFTSTKQAYDFWIKIMFGSHLPLVVCRTTHVFLCFWICFRDVQHFAVTHFIRFFFGGGFVFAMCPVPSVASLYGLSILDCPFDFLKHLFTAMIKLN